MSQNPEEEESEINLKVPLSDLQGMAREIAELKKARTELLRANALLAASHGLPNEHTGPRLQPTGWTSNSNAPYYRQRYAEELKPLLDLMIDDSENNRKILCNRTGLSTNTLYLKVSQAWLFLCDHLDPDGKYRALKAKTKLRREPNGVVIRWKDDVVTQVSIPTERNITANMEGDINDKWREELITFVENASEGDAAVIQGFNPESPEARGFLDNLIAGSDLKILRRNASGIKIYKGEIPREEK